MAASTKAGQVQKVALCYYDKFVSYIAKGINAISGQVNHQPSGKSDQV